VDEDKWQSDKESSLQGADVYAILRSIGATFLHHANSVSTSCTFLEQGALLSRDFVESQHLIQTPQGSDEIDKKYQIWHCVFVDHVDIHDRGGRRKGPNQYGPVLFVQGLDILLTLPPGANVFVTKSNPIHWYDNQPVTERWFQSAQELAGSIRFGDFDKMLVIQVPSEKIEFPNHRVQVVVDNPQRQLSSGEDAYTYAVQRLTAAAAVGHTGITIQQRECRDGCLCVEKYRGYTPGQIDFWFK
jgi:hypothetical protein